MGDRTPRLWVERLPAEGGPVALPIESARHARVLRLTAGDPVVLFDGSGATARAVMTADARRRLACDAEAPERTPEPSRRLSVLVGLTKGSKLDGVARMLTELGVDRLALCLCERSVPEPREAGSRLARLQRISLEACGQSGRARPLTIEGPAPLLELAAGAPQDATRIVCWERAQHAMPALPAHGDVWVVVGPEGGLSATEVRSLTELGYAEVGLGALILRVETAAPVVAALLSERLGRLRGP